MKTRILSILTSFFLIFSFSYAQSQNMEFGIGKLMNKQDGIEVYAKHYLCLIEPAPNDYHFISVKIVNTNSIEKEVSFYIKNF